MELKTCLSLTHEGKRCIINNTIILELSSQTVKKRKEEPFMFAHEISMADILKVYSEYGIVQEKAQQTEAVAEPKVVTHYEEPSLYEQVPVYFTDRVNY